MILKLVIIIKKNEYDDYFEIAKENGGNFTLFYITKNNNGEFLIGTNSGIYEFENLDSIKDVEHFEIQLIFLNFFLPYFL